MKFFGWLLVGMFWMGGSASASTTLDTRYSAKRVGILILDPAKNPVYSTAVGSALSNILEGQGRFEMAPARNTPPETRWMALEPFDLGQPGNIQIPPWVAGRIAQLKPDADSVILADLQNDASGFRLLFAWITTDEPQTLASAQVPVEPNLTASSLAIATQNGWDKLVSALPFDGTIISREGYRVIIDRGAPDAWKKRILPVYTVDSADGDLSLVETGIIEITEPQDNISFGKILAENRPYQIEVTNKFRFVDPAKFEDHLVLMRPEIGRKLSSVSQEWYTPTRRLGFIDVGMGASLLSFSQLSALGQGASSDNVAYPSGNIHAEIWATRAIFFHAELGGSMATITPDTSNQSLQSASQKISAQLGYRFRLQKTTDPSLDIRTGILRHHLQVEASHPPIAFTSTTYSGLITGAGARFPLNDHSSIHFDVDTLLFPSFEETPFSSGKDAISITLVQFALGGTLQLSDAIDINARLSFLSAGAELAGPGTRPGPIASIQQDSRALTVGARYYF